MSRRTLRGGGGAGTLVAQSFGERLRRQAIRAEARKGLAAIEAGVMGVAPTITSNSTGTWGSGVTSALTTRVVAKDSQSQFKFRGGTPTVVSTNYLRFPVVTLPTGTGNAVTSPTQRNAYGWAVEWLSDAPILDIQVLNGASKTARLLVDGLAYPTNLAYPAISGDGIFTVDWTNAGGRKTRHYRWEGNGDAGFRSVGVDTASKVWALPDMDQVKAAFLGDSVCADTGATDPNGGWQHLLGKLIGWADVRQVGLGSSGFVNTGTYNSTFGDATRLADLVEINPNVLFAMCTVNDQGKTAGAVQAAVLAALTSWRATFPTVPIILGGLWSGAGNGNSQQITVETEAKAAFDAFADPNSYWVPIVNDTIGNWVSGTGYVGATSGSGNSDVYNQDGSHPNQEGHKYLAERWNRALRASVLPNVS